MSLLISFGVYRPEGETTILPSTWHETGIAVFGEIGRFDYELQLVNGLDPQGFRSEDWIKTADKEHSKSTISPVRLCSPRKLPWGKRIKSRCFFLL